MFGFINFFERKHSRRRSHFYLMQSPSLSLLFFGQRQNHRYFNRALFPLLIVMCCTVLMIIWID